MANPTTNYGFVLPTPSDLVTDLPADFDIALQGVDTRLKALQPGTTLGDLAYSSATANTNTRLGIGSTNQVLTVSGGVPAWANSFQFAPNLIINGAFIVNQRVYVSAANLASGSYGFDRWKSNYTNTTLTFTAGINATTVTISSSGGIQQIVERQNVPAGTYTLSWSGTATGRVYNSGGTPPSYAASPITFTADGLADVVVEFTASGGTRTCGLVKFEQNSSASTFSLAGGTFEGELAACQRYYQKSYNQSTAPASGTSIGAKGFQTTGNVITANVIGGISFGTAMRTTPTVTIYGQAGGSGKVSNGDGTDLAASSGTAIWIGETGFAVQNASGGSITPTYNVLQCHYVASAEL